MTISCSGAMGRAGVSARWARILFIVLLGGCWIWSAAAPIEAASGDDPAAAATSEPRYEFRLDPYLGAESGAPDVASTVSFLAEGEARLGAGVALRSVRTILWDLPVGWWFGVVLHEGFGHGGRGREFDAAPGVHLGTPWEGRVSYTSFDSRGRSTEELLYIYAGGTESNSVAASLLERRAVEGVRLRPLDLFFLASNRLVATRYVLRTTPDPRRSPGRFYQEYAGGGDVANYLGLLNELHGDGSGITPTGVDAEILGEWNVLRRQAWVNAADPGLWWALGSAFKMVARGDDAPPLRMPRLGTFRFMPVLSTEWTPSGGEVSLEWVMAPLQPAGRIPAWFSLVARRGEGPSGPFGALGTAGEDLRRLDRLTLGGAAEVWHDPRNGLGGGARLRLRFTRGTLRGLYVDLGCKSQGYWVGQPATPGPFGGIGLRYER